MKYKSSLTLIFIIAGLQYSLCQQKDNNGIAGIWKGTSLCQVKNSPCHDEVVVYHISKAGTDSTYSVRANKVVNGTEEEMGELNFTYNAGRHLFVCHYKNQKGQESLWEFQVSKNEMKGKLVLYEGNILYRIIELKHEL